MMAASTYLIVYNITCFIGWSMCLAYTVVHLLQGSSTADLYQTIEKPLQITQSLAVLEVAHAGLGLVRSPLMTTAQQVASRLFVVWGILAAAPGATAGDSLTLATVGDWKVELNLFTLLIAWGVTEVIRYSFYATKELGATPYALTWLRYTTFIFLYPLGVASELAMVWLALPRLRATGQWNCPMPNPFNMSFDYSVFCVLAMLAYVPGFPPLYMYMFRQRAKVLGSPSKKKAA